MSHPLKAFAPALLLSLSGLSAQLVAHPDQAAASSQAPAPRLARVVQFAPTEEESVLVSADVVHLLGSDFGADPRVLEVRLNGVLLGPHQYRRINTFLIVMSRKTWDSVATPSGTNHVQVLRPGSGNPMAGQLLVQGEPRTYAGPQAMLTGHGAASSRTVADDLDAMVRGAFHFLSADFPFDLVPPAVADAQGTTVPASAEPAPHEFYGSPLFGAASSSHAAGLVEPMGLDAIRQSLSLNPFLSLPLSPAQSGQATPAQNAEHAGPPLVVTNSTGRAYRLTLTRADQPLFLLVPTAGAEARRTEVRPGVPVAIPALATVALAPGVDAKGCTVSFTLEAAPQEDAQGRDHFQWQFREAAGRPRGMAGSLVRVNTNERPHSSSLFHQFRIDSVSALTIRAAGPQMTEASFEDLLKRAMTGRGDHGDAPAPSRAPSVAEAKRPLVPATPAASLAAASVGEGDDEAQDASWADSMDDDAEVEAALTPPQRMQIEEDVVSLPEAVDETMAEAETPDEDEEDLEEEASTSAEEDSEDPDSDYRPRQREHATSYKVRSLNRAAAQAKAAAKPQPGQAPGNKRSARHGERLPLARRKVLEAWFFAHWDHPYPTDPELEVLVSTTGLRKKQVRDWFTNTRKRAWTRSPQAAIDKVFGAYFAQAQATPTPSKKRKQPPAPTAPSPQASAAAAASPALASPRVAPPVNRSSSRPLTRIHAPTPQPVRANDPRHPMVAWILAHADDPYPTPEEKQHFANTLNLTYNQVQSWFINYRMRHLQNRPAQRTPIPEAPAAEPPLKRQKQ